MLLIYSYLYFTFLDSVKAILVHRAHLLLSESTRILCTLRNTPGGFLLACRYVGGYEHAGDFKEP